MSIVYVESSDLIYLAQQYKSPGVNVASWAAVTSPEIVLLDMVSNTTSRSGVPQVFCSEKDTYTFHPVTVSAAPSSSTKVNLNCAFDPVTKSEKYVPVNPFIPSDIFLPNTVVFKRVMPHIALYRPCPAKLFPELSKYFMFLTTL